MSMPDARRYMVQLINRDRQAAGLRPVALDEGPPSIAGQRHAQDMLRVGFVGHWGSDGSVPEQRLTEAGGSDMVMENAACIGDEQPRPIDPNARFSAADLERIERLFMDEVPPNDGHKKNILTPTHTHVGIGLAMSPSTAKEIPFPCLNQEFLAVYGSHEKLPSEHKKAQPLRVAGKVVPEVRVTGVGVVRLETPAPLAAAELNKRRSYPVPRPSEMFWGKGMVTRVPMDTDGQSYQMMLPADVFPQPGLYAVSVWANFGKGPESKMVSLRTLRVL